jgi:hypothetical protein
MPTTTPEYGIDHAGFVLYNTHSAPVRKEDSGLPVGEAPGAQRWFEVDPTGTLNAVYYSPDWEGLRSDALFTSPISERMTQSQVNDFYNWAAAGGTWFSPFFTEDSRHVFYVTTSGTPPPTQIFSPVGPGSTRMAPLGTARAAIPPLIISPRAAKPQPGRITHVIATAAAVTYHGSVITSDGGAASGRATAGHEGA